MYVEWKVAATTLLSALVVSACAPAAPANGVEHGYFRFTCCVPSELQQATHPGQVLTLRWIAESAGMTSDASSHPITLTAVLTGPFPSVAALKARGPYRQALSAAPIHVTDRSAGSPVSNIALPLNLPAGWYNLAFNVESAGANAYGGSSIVEVTSSGP